MLAAQVSRTQAMTKATPQIRHTNGYGQEKTIKMQTIVIFKVIEHKEFIGKELFRS